MTKVLVDTNIWSAFLRRSKEEEQVLRRNIFELVESSRIAIIGPIRQEILCGIRDPIRFEKLLEYLDGFSDQEIVTKDYEDAARLQNLCSSKGIASSAIDLLIVAFAVNRGIEIYTRDGDFIRYQQIANLHLYEET
ncbi:MAG: PIN domain-containing protein [Bacteroidota bacterium]